MLGSAGGNGSVVGDGVLGSVQGSFLVVGNVKGEEDITCVYCYPGSRIAGAVVSVPNHADPVPLAAVQGSDITG